MVGHDASDPTVIALLPYQCVACGESFIGNVVVGWDSDLSGPIEVLCCTCAAGVGARLDEMDETEWWDVCQRVRPDISEPDFARSWQEFQAMKRSRSVL